MTTKETIAFQAETKQLLDLVIHSLYTNKEIFLRELISNASDALDRLRYEALTNESIEVDSAALRVLLEVDAEKRILEIDDNGIGMTREELIQNIGTIASSGTKGFIEALQESKTKGVDSPDLIGQFGVGFYSAFMVADKVEVETRRIGEEKGFRWISESAGDYTIEEIEKESFGTTIVLHLKELEKDADGQTDFTAEWVLRDVVKRYSDFIEYPVQLETGEGDDAKLETINSMKPLWTRSKSEISDDEYDEFYKHLTHDWNKPLDRVHFTVEGVSEYTALLYIPSQRPMDLFDPNQAKSKVQLFVRRVFITKECEELVPVWLRFVAGLVDSADLPLNVSRETLQHNRQISQIKKRVVRKVLDTLSNLQKNRREDYVKFWDAFGPVMKEGIYYDDDNREDVAKLALFHSTKDEATVTLPEYVERMSEDQEDIFVLLAQDLETARRSPHLEKLAAKGWEVLLMVDPVDDFVLQRLTQFQEHAIKRVERGEIDLEEESEKTEREAKEKEYQPVLEHMKKELGDEVEDVRFSSRLTDSPACLVAGANDMAPQMRRMLKDSGQEVPESKQVLELNPSHPLVARLQSLSEDEQAGAEFGATCELLLGAAHVNEGEAPPNPARFSKLLTDLMLKES